MGSQDHARQLAITGHFSDALRTLDSTTLEDLPVDGERSVISGHMRELMTFAQRIARTNVNVLITGESGTGILGALPLLRSASLNGTEIAFLPRTT